MQNSMRDNQEGKAVYFGELEVEGVKCFKDRQRLELRGKDGKYARLTVVLGENGTGKTTLLTCLLGMSPTEFAIGSEEEGQSSYPTRTAKGFPVFDGLTSMKYLSATGEVILCKGRAAWEVEIDSASNKAIRFWDSKAAYTALLPFKLFWFHESRSNAKFSVINPNYVASKGGIDTDFEIEEYLQSIDYSRKLLDSSADRHWKLITELLISVMPDLHEFRGNSLNASNFIEVRNDFGWVRYRDLGHGFQTTIVMLASIAASMIAENPNSPDPFSAPAIILVDEIDLHLHPEWQKTILQDISIHFPNVQFIVTTHSPLVIQSLEKFNLAILKQENGLVTIENRQDANFQGWSVEEILEDVMGVKEAHSERYASQMSNFSNALDNDDYVQAKKALDDLEMILPKNSSLRTILRVQMSSLLPPEAV
jgi:predicted ATPase